MKDRLQESEANLQAKDKRSPWQTPEFYRFPANEAEILGATSPDAAPLQS